MANLILRQRLSEATVPLNLALNGVVQEGETQTKAVDIYWRWEDEPTSEPQYLASGVAGFPITVPFDPKGREIRFYMISKTETGVASDRNVREAEQIVFNPVASRPEDEAANTVYAGPTTGADAEPTFRLLVAADIPSLSGTYQPLDATLTAFGALTIAANSLTIGTGADAFSQTSFAANTFPARASTGDLVAKTITDFGLSLIDDADAAAARTTLGLVIGTNVQAYDADLTTWAGITPGTGVATALAVNVGTAGAFVVNGGALGTPSSGTLTNCTFPTLNQNTTGSAATLTTTRTIWGQNFNGSANVSGTLALGVSDLTLTGSIGATGARATKVWTAALESTAMPTVGGTSLSSTFSPIAGSASIVTVGTVTTGTWNGTDIAVADGGTGRSTSTTAYGLIAAGTTATGAHQTLAAGATTEILVGGGASALPVWTTATGSGSPVRATSPTLTTPILGAATATSLTMTGQGAGYEGTWVQSASSPYSILTITQKGGSGGWAGQIDFATGFSGGTAATVFSIRNTGTNGVANVYLGGIANRSTSNGESTFNIFNGTAPSGTLTNGISLYSASGELRVMDAAGNSTLLSPHDKDGNWIHDEINYKGRRLRVDMERMVKALDEMLGGGFVQEFLIEK